MPDPHDGPDLICIGLPRAGTGWLYDQLAGHPDFWMPPIKELAFLGRGFPPPALATAVARAKARTDDSGRGIPANRRPLDARDFAFFDRAERAIASSRSLDDYASLFEPKGALKSGDITPTYGRLRPEIVEGVARRFPNVRVVLLLRDPVERAWSHWRMRVALGRDATDDPQDAGAFERFLAMEKTRSVADAPAIAARWRAAFKDRFRWFFLDDVKERPVATRAAVLDFVGADPDKPSRAPAGHNRKDAGAAPRSPAIQKVMRARLSEERRRFAKTFGGPATAWPDAPY